MSLRAGLTWSSIRLPRFLRFHNPAATPSPRTNGMPAGFVAAAAVGGDLPPHRFRDELLALAKAHDVDVVFGEQPQARLQRGKCGIARENVPAPTFDVDLLELVAERVEERAGIGGPECGRREPLAKVTRPRGAVGAQVAAADLEQRRLLLHLPPAVDPLVRSHEGDPAALRRPLAKLGQEERETREQTLPRAGTDSLHDLLGELVPPEAPAVERVPDRRTGRLHVVGPERGVQHALRIAPGFQPVGVIRRRADRTPGRVPEWQLAGGMKMKRAAQRPGLDERPP